jgi:hypothetical protein
MRLKTLDQLADAKRKSQLVSIYGRYEGQKVLIYEGSGYIIDFSEDGISILNPTVGPLNFLRENVDVLVTPRWQLRARRR